MAYIRGKPRQHGNTIAYELVESRRVGPNRQPREHIIQYIGATDHLVKFAADMYNKLAKLEKDMGVESGTGDTRKASIKTGKHAARPATQIMSRNSGAIMTLYRCARTLGIEEMLEEVTEGRQIQGMKQSRILLLRMIQQIAWSSSQEMFHDWVNGTSRFFAPRFQQSSLDAAALMMAVDHLTMTGLRSVARRLGEKVLETCGMTSRAVHMDDTGFTLAEASGCHGRGRNRSDDKECTAPQNFLINGAKDRQSMPSVPGSGKECRYDIQSLSDLKHDGGEDTGTEGHCVLPGAQVHPTDGKSMESLSCTGTQQVRAFITKAAGTGEVIFAGQDLYLQHKDWIRLSTSPLSSRTIYRIWVDSFICWAAMEMAEAIHEKLSQAGCRGSARRMLYMLDQVKHAAILEVQETSETRPLNWQIERIEDQETQRLWDVVQQVFPGSE